ncbi:KT5AA-like protein [Mya arenaria]|uniref:KT5AA-like protein n=1 Tax=Mya arenaria TaxID=6604 RepID=A0ABY7F7C7_MYAAR|nr:KT5AA-like protein [Mya arenaria]
MDATSELDVGPRLGRLVNHGGKGKNCVMKTLEFNKRPYLCLFAAKDIPQGEELLYDYGIEDLPWENWWPLLTIWRTCWRPRLQTI